MAVDADVPSLAAASATELARRLERGGATSVSILTACLARIAVREEIVRAWQYLDREHALRHASELDAQPRRGPLHGIPIGVKDLIDTADMPTSYGSRLYAGHRPATDATCVSRLRQAGGVIIGKTVTTEFAASYEAAATRHPLDPTRTPGGSSSGSAAAVADRMVPLALGTQTGGSVLRPASFCGVFGYKPTFGAISRAGVKPVSPSLDTVGIFARSVADLGMLADVLVGRDPLDVTTDIAPVDLAARHLGADAPRIAYIPTPWLDEAEPYVRRSLETLAQTLSSAGATVHEVALPPRFAGLVQAAAIVMDVEGARALGADYDRARAQFEPGAAKLVEAGRARSDAEYRGAVELGRRCREELAMLIDDLDVALLPVATGEAPTYETTGDPLFCRPWTMLGNPTVSVPGLSGPSGLPLGVQVLGKPSRDGELLRAADWIARHLACADG